MRASIQLAVCTLVGMAASPAAFAVPIPCVVFLDFSITRLENGLIL
jgi:hypothetical protein